MAADDYAIVVGISKYPRFGDLAGPENDAREFCRWLRSPQGGDIDADDHVALVLSSEHYDPAADPIDAQPTLHQVEREFDRLIDLDPGEGGMLGRRLYIYMAGHGFGPDIEETALLVANSSRRRMHHFPGRYSARWFRAAALFQEIVLLMDCCRDDYPRVPLYIPAWPEIRRPAGADVRYFYGFATKWSRKAREKPVAPNGPVRGLFTRALLEALEKATPDANNCITGAVVEEYVLNYLPKLVDTADYQEPQFEYNYRRDIVFVQKGEIGDVAEESRGAEIPVRIHLASALANRPVEIVNHKYKRVAGPVTIAGVWALALPNGLYSVRVTEMELEKEFEVIGEEVVDVEFG
ncbi:MAG: caspase family protein [Anaerolineae bacterium]|nr:caspase family protein [Anaerolineae bacterium]